MSEHPEPTGAGDDRDLTRRSLRGLSWAYANTAIVALLQIGVTAALARLLTPRAFGLVALGNLTLSFVNYFARAGITQALVQKPHLTEDDIRAGFTLSAGLGLAFSSAVALAAPFIATAFDDPALTPVLQLLGLSMLLSGLRAPSEALLRRDLRFKTIALRNTSAYVVGYGGFGIGLAASGAGVYALVAAALGAQALDLLLSYAVVRHSVLPSRSREAYRAVLSFGSRVSAISFLEFLGLHADTAAVGRFAGTGPLGLYNRGNLLAQLPFEYATTALTRVLNRGNLLAQLPFEYATTALTRVLYPSFSRIQNELPRLRGAFLGATGAVAAMVVPAAAGLAAAAPEVVRVVLGERFLGTVPVLPWLAAFAAVSMVTHLSSMLAETRAALNTKLVVAGAKVLVLLGLLAFAAGRDLWWYAAALLGAAVFEHVAYVLVMRRIVGAGPRAIVVAYLPAVLTAAVVVAVIGALRIGLLRLGWPVATILVAELLAGVAVLAWAFRWGPLGVVRRDVAVRLRASGMLDGETRLPRVLRWLLESDR